MSHPNRILESLNNLRLTWRDGTPQEREGAVAQLSRDAETYEVVTEMLERGIARFEADQEAEYRELQEALFGGFVGYPHAVVDPADEDNIIPWPASGEVRRQEVEAPRSESMVQLLGALEAGAEAAVEVLRALGVDLVWEGERIVLIDARFLLERVDGVWEGQALVDGLDDEVLTGAELEDALVWVVPYREVMP